MKRILLTGGSGFIGRNIIPILREKYNVDAPTRDELDLRNSRAVSEYIIAGNYDVIIQGANPNPVKNSTCDKADTMLEDSIRIFMNFYRMREYCSKLFYFGSGAEFDKSGEICLFTEDMIGKSIPCDSYGLAKYTFNELARTSNNVYNLRIFGCYGPYDHESKFITHAIRCCLNQQDITIKQNCRFDYMQIFDLAKVIDYMIDSSLEYHDYNICTAKPISLYDIARIVREQMGMNNEIVLLKDGYNREYTGNNNRFLKTVSGEFEFTDIQKGIEIQIAHERAAAE